MDGRDIAAGVGALMLRAMIVVAIVCVLIGAAIGWALG